MILSSEICHLLPTNSSSVLSCKYGLMEYFFSHIPIVLSWAHHKVHSKDRMKTILLFTIIFFKTII